MKKLLSIVLCIVLAVSCMAFAAVTASADALPRYVVLALDVSYSMDSGSPVSRMDSQKSAAKSFCEKTLGSNGNKIAVVLFGSGASVLCDFTDDTALLSSKIDSIETNGATYFYDAFEKANEVLNQEAAKGVKFERNIVLCSDGTPLGGKSVKDYVYTKDDYSDYDNANAALKYVDENLRGNTKIYTIGFYQNMRSYDLDFAKTFMSDLSTEKSVIVDNGDDLVDAFDTTATAITSTETPDTPDPAANTSSITSSSTSSASGNTSTAAVVNATNQISGKPVDTGDTTAASIVFVITLLAASSVAAVVSSRKKESE